MYNKNVSNDLFRKRESLSRDTRRDRERQRVSGFCMYAIFCTNITSNRALNKRKSYRLARFHQKLGQFTIPIA